MPAAPPAISSQSRRKQKNSETVENQGVKQNDGNSNIAQQLHHSSVSTDDAIRAGGTRVNRLLHPHTPQEKNQINFADLIANPEDLYNRQITATPTDQVEWKHGPTSSITSRSARSTQQSRKRARSSSPITSQRAGRSKRPPIDKTPLDLESIGRSLRTPKHEDPLLALWDKYADDREHVEPNEPILPPLPPMSSSPNTPNALRKAENLRRTASCGIEWPTSISKRRRVGDPDPHKRAKGIFAASKGEILSRENSKHSRVSMLVDSIHKTLVSKSIPEEDAPASSSPLPERHESLKGSPAKGLRPLSRPNITASKPTSNGSQDLESPDKSSDFGGIDFDMDDPDLVSALEQAGSQRNLSPLRKVHTAAQLRDSHSPPVRGYRPSSADPIPKHNRSVERVTQPQDEMQQDTNRKNKQNMTETLLQNSFDEFDDEDDDFTIELAELADKVESQDPTISLTRPTVGPSRGLDPQEEDMDEFDDAFDDDDENGDLWEEVDCKATQVTKPAVRSTSQKSNDHRAIKRYLIVDISESQYDTAQSRKRLQKILSIKDEKRQGQLYTILLRQSWYDTRCSKDSYVHLIGEFDFHGQCIVDDKDNMVILHPDHLISATVVADSFSCTRRAILQDRIKATAPAEPPQVYGHLIHEVFGEALKQNKWDLPDLRQIVEKLLPSYLESLYEINHQMSDAIEYVMGKMPELKAWASIFVNADLLSDAAIRDRNGALVPFAINKLLELEEHVWSPMYGLKGNIDATIQARMKLAGDRTARTLTVPLELKTGKRDSNEMHRAQTALYTLLLSDRYDINITSGVLYYLETSKTFRVEGIRNEIRHMIIQRNDLACYVHDKLALPPMIKKEHLCKKCYAQTSCFAYHKLVENGDGSTSGMRAVFDTAVGHLKPIQQNFFKKWDDLLTKEERDAMKFKRELWTMLSTEREAVGRCFSNVVIEPGSAIENNEAVKINRYTYTFVKHKPQPAFSFAESQIAVGEPIVVSDEKGHFALANGFVTNIRPTRITVAVDRRLQNARRKQAGFDAEKNQVFSAIMEVDRKDKPTDDSTDPTTPTLYRVDKDEFANGMSIARNNIIRIMEKDLFRARELRQLIIDLKAPAFKQTSTAYTLSGPASQMGINEDQRQAIAKVMSARDYALVLGMPGTGKTTTIAHIIRALVAQGKSVLLTSYTHTAVDNILLKIKDENISILRLGALGKIHPDVQNFADLGSVPKKTLAELESSWRDSKVVATTCLGINHAIFNHRKFDYCIVDEASQITLPVCLGPIRLSSTFILVGDHYQLPPLVQNKEAQQGGLDISLFKLLSDAQPSSVVTLEHQYRMAEDIQILSNKLIYSGRLKCGTSAVASRMLSIPRLEAGMEAHHKTSGMVQSPQSTSVCIPSGTKKCWLEKALTPQNRTIFLNTDTVTSQSSKLGAPEIHAGSGTRITNSIEATLTAQLLTTLIRSGVPPRSIGIITFYRSQLALLKSVIKAMAGTSAASDVEMHTADKYQGRDKEVIILSCVRSNESCNVGELLKDWRRVNVALTRARSKLIILGSAKTLKGSEVPVLEGLMNIVMEKRWILDLPVDAANLHFFEGSGTQTQISQQRQVIGPRGDMTTISPVKNTNLERMPLGAATGNTTPRKTGSKLRKPSNTVHGSINVDNLLGKRPIMKNVADELDDEHWFWESTGELV